MKRKNAKPSPKPEDLALAKRAAEAIRKLYPEAEVILYGSRARGKPVEFSDMDILVLTPEKLPWKEEERIMAAISPLEDETDVLICPLVEERERWYSDKYQAMPVAEAIKAEGIRL